ncbi:LytR/AlgR family response regulator transcription factor [Pedobacter ginsenosidimutans]|uniref:LytR/AlgR family response regulator transcription factor n=1 Tax=Pedobacter ginsenosidimutans TaxID=687842 RepID=UPI0009FA6C03|nr:response regulator [Pedobacter ginsenosidimutans]
MINCLIVDDEPLAQQILEDYVKAHEGLSLVGKCSTAFEAFEVSHQQKIDLMFLDVKMPALNGIDFLKSLKNPPAVIFTTAYSEFAVMSYELDAVDYLLKPITTERFQKSLNKLFKSTLTIPLEQKDYSYFKVSGKLLKVFHRDILYAQSVKDYILLQTKTDRFLTHMTMKNLEEILSGELFIRIHRSYLVNKDRIEAVGKSKIQIGEEWLPVGSFYRSNLSLIN